MKMLLKGFSIAIALLLLMSQPASAQTSLQNLSVTAWIDGRDLLYITPNGIHWHHLDYAAVGRLGGQNLPAGLFMNRRGPNTLDLSWIPGWPCVSWECRGEEMDSSSFVLGEPLPSQYQLTGFKVIRARYSVRVYQYPSADNEYTTIIDFNDDPSGGADWYTVKLTFAPLSGSMEANMPVSGGADTVTVNGQSTLSRPAPEGLATIYSNLGTGDQAYNCCTGLTTTGPISPVGEYIEVGNAFTPTDNYMIAEVQVAVGYALGTNAVTVGVWSDDNGVPGTPIKQWYPKNLHSDGSCCKLRTIIESTGVPVTAGTQYWFVVRQCVDSLDTWNAWNLNTNNAFGPVATKVSHGRWTNQGNQLQGAFAVFGK
ncbi:MAG: hypothetical protein WB952_03865 [Terriglobales bacterium]